MIDIAVKNVVLPNKKHDLILLAGYRLFISVVLFSIVYADIPPYFLADRDPNLYIDASIVYVITAAVLLITTVSSWGNLWTVIDLVFDVLMITVIAYASGGFQTGFGTLLLVVVISGGALLSGWQALSIATLATCMVLLEVVYAGGESGYNHVLTLGITFFVTTVMAQVLSNRIKMTRQIADHHAGSVNRLEVLNSHIVSRLQVGVIVVNQNDSISLINKFAQKLLGVSGIINGGLLRTHSIDLFEQLKQWQQNKSATPDTFHLQLDSGDILPQMIALEGGDTLIFLNDMSALIQQAHQIKLASLGRMAASIAHEIRNPLSAISHAGQLLSERDAVGQQEQKLLDIINRHVDRINDIIKSVLQLGQRKDLTKTTFSLIPWIKNFVEEFKRDQEGIGTDQFLLEITAPPIDVMLAEGQLRQIMVNLCSNAWYHAMASADDRGPQVIVRMTTVKGQTVIDVLDSGLGVPKSALSKLFDPFHSERSGGTGLGLFIAREMAQVNGLKLDYIAQKQQNEGFFRVIFSS